MGRHSRLLLFTRNSLRMYFFKKMEKVMKHIFFAGVFASITACTPLLVFAANASAVSQSDQAAALDKSIKEFTDARDVAKMKAYEAGSDADRFLGQNWTDYQQAIRKQERYEQAVRDLDEKIKELEQQRAALNKK